VRGSPWASIGTRLARRTAGHATAPEPDIGATLPPPVLSWVRSVLPHPDLVATPPQTQMASARGRVVHELADHRGQAWYLKIEPRVRAWEREVHAYRQWATAMPGLTPAMPFAQRELQTMLLTAVPGEASSGRDLDHHRRAGSWLRHFHGAEPPRTHRAPFTGGRRLDRMRQRHPHAVQDAEFEFARGAVALLERRPELEPLLVPGHGDFRPHNWLVDGAGLLRVIDFGDSGLHPPTRDFAALAYGWWQRLPGAKDAFLAGYGRELTQEEEQAVFARSCHRALWDIFEGHRLGVRPSIRRGRRRLRALVDSAHEG